MKAIIIGLKLLGIHFITGLSLLLFLFSGCSSDGDDDTSVSTPDTSLNLYHDSALP